jgi:hypothetical protein
MPKEYAAEVVAAWPDGAAAQAADWCAGLPSAEGGEGFTIPAEVAYAGVAARLPEGLDFHGSQVVAARILTLDYLWWDDFAYDERREGESVHGQVCTVIVMKKGERTVRVWVDRKTGALM